MIIEITIDKLLMTIAIMFAIFAIVAIAKYNNENLYWSFFAIGFMFAMIGLFLMSVNVSDSNKCLEDKGKDYCNSLNLSFNTLGLNSKDFTCVNETNREISQSKIFLNSEIEECKR